MLKGLNHFMDVKTNNKQYSESDIQILEGLEAVRKRPPYIALLTLEASSTYLGNS